MTRGAALCAVCAVIPAQILFAQTPSTAADCAAFNWANWDYDVKNYVGMDADPLWQAQARAFEDLAEAQGMARAQIDQHVVQHRGAMYDLIKEFAVSDRAAAMENFHRQANLCRRLIDKTPELSQFR